MKALIVVGKSEYNVHVPLAKKAASIMKEKGYDTEFVNTAATDRPDVLKYFMQKAEPDFLITFDCAGFELDLLGGDLFYNSLCCPAAHVLLDRPYNYIEELSNRMNFTMKFYTLGREDADYINSHFIKVPEACTVESIQMDDIGEENVIVPGTYIQSGFIMEQINKLPDTYYKLNTRIIDEYTNGNSNLYSIADNIDIMPVCELAMQYIRMNNIESTISELIERGTHVNVAGTGWQNFEPFIAGRVTRIGDDTIQAEQIAESISSMKLIDIHSDRPDICSIWKFISR